MVETMQEAITAAAYFVHVPLYSMLGHAVRAPSKMGGEASMRFCLDAIDAAMPAHLRFLKKYYASGHFLVSGRKIPREGGVIVGVSSSREEIDAIAREDPFCARGLAEYRIVQFKASQQAGQFGSGGG